MGDLASGTGESWVLAELEKGGDQDAEGGTLTEFALNLDLSTHLLHN